MSHVPDNQTVPQAEGWSALHALIRAEHVSCIVADAQFVTDGNNKSRTSTKPGPRLDAETLRGKMHGETNGRTLQGACHLVRGLPWPRLNAADP